MGQIVLSSELSGRKFGFNIAGDAPTVDEQMYIDNIMRQQDAQFIEEYRGQFGISPTDEGEGLANYAGEIFKGVGRGGVNLLEQAGLGAASLLPEEQELAVREAIRSTAYDFKPQADIGMEDTVGGKFGEGLGSFAPLLATSLIPGVGLPLSAGLAISAGAGEASERAREAGATQEERNLATRYGAAVGLTEVLPIKLGMLDKILEGSGLKKRAGRILQQAGLEGLQEFAANTAQNLIEQGIYNPEKELGEGGLEAAGYGAGVGGFVQLVADLLVPRRGRKAVIPTDDEKTAVEEASNVVKPDPERDGTSPEGSEPSVAGSEGGDGRAVDTAQPAAPDDGAVGGGVLDTVGVDDAAGDFGDTLSEADAFELAAQQFAEPQKVRDITSAIMGETDLLGNPIDDGEVIEDDAVSETKSKPIDQATAVQIQQWLQSNEPFNGVPPTIYDLKESNAEKRAADKVKQAAAVYDQKYGIGPTDVGLPHRRTPSARWNGMDVVEAQKEAQESNDPAMLEAVQNLQEAQVELAKVRERDSSPREDAKRALKDMFPEYSQQIDSDVYGFVKQATEVDISRIEPMFTPQQALETEEPVDFVTERGSTYSIKEGNRTKRNRAPDAKSGEFVEQPISGKTVYMTYEDIVKFGGLFQQGEPGLYKFVPVEGKKNRAHLVLTEDYGPNRKGDAVEGTEVSFTMEPAVGLNPVEIYNSTNTNKRNIHFGSKITEVNSTKPKVDDAVEAQKALNAEKAAERNRKPARQVIPGYIYPTDPKTLQPSGKPYPESDTRYAPVAASKATPAELEPSVLTPESTDVPAIPTMEVLDGLGVSKGTAAYQIAKNRLAKSIADNDRDAIRADIADVFSALGKLKTKDAQLKARVDEYVAKATPKEQTPEAKARRADTARLRSRRIQEEDLKIQKREGQQVVRDEARAREAAKKAEATLDTPEELITTAEDFGTEKRAEEYQALRRNMPRASLGQEPVRGLGRERTKSNKEDKLEKQILAAQDRFARARNAEAQDEATAEIVALQAELAKEKSKLDAKRVHNEAFANWLRENKFVQAADGSRRRPTGPEDFSPAQVATLYQDFTEAQNEQLQAIVFEGSAKPKTKDQKKKALYNKNQFIDYLRRTYAPEEVDRLLRAKNKEELAELRAGYVSDTDYKKSFYDYDFDVNRLTLEATVGLSRPLDADTVTMLEDGNLADALRRYADQAPNPIVAKMAKALSRLTGTTRVVFADIPGGRVAGAYNPRTNTIVFNQNVPLVGHTFMHEMLHAATISQIVNAPNKAAVKKLDNIFNEVKDKLPSAYGSQSLVEFVAEAFSNPKFQSQLAALRLTGTKGSLLDQLKRAVARIVNFVKGQPTISAMAEVEALVDGILAPAPEYMDVDTLYNIANDPADARRATNAAISNGPIFDARNGNKMLAWLEDTSRGGVSEGYGLAKTVALRATPLHYLVQLGEKYFSKGLMDSINNTMNKAAGRLQEDYDATEAIVGDMVKWSNNNPDKVEAFNSLINDSTIYQIDPELSEAQAIQKYENDATSLDIHRRLRELFREVGPEGQRQYRQTRNFFRKMRTDLQNAVASRLSQAGVPEDVQNRILNDFYAKLTQQGAIEPYFPLTRKGDNWLFFTAVDPNTGALEYYAESFESEQQRNRAWSELRSEIVDGIMNSPAGQTRMQSFRDDPSINTEGMEDAQVAELVSGVTATVSIPNNWYNNTPNTNFVNQLMSQIAQAPIAETQAAADLRQQTMDEVSKLILNTLPETSYVQSFRKRRQGKVAKAALSTRQDAIRTISDRARSLTRQIVEMEYNAEFNRLNAQLREEISNRVGKDPGVSDAEKRIFDELNWFTRNGVKQKHTQLSRLLTGIAFNMTLGANVSGGLINLSQMPLIVYPMLAAKHGPVKTMRAMALAGKIMANGGLTRKIEGVSDAIDADGNPIMEEKIINSAVSIANYDFNDPNMSEDIRELKELVETGIDLGQFKRSLDYEILDLDQMKKRWARFNKATGFFLHHGERINREVTLVASYKLALDSMSAEDRANPAMRKQAAAQAVADAEMMNGGLAANATPRLAQNDLGRVVFMYKKYGVTMLSLLHKLGMQALKGQSPEARRLAMGQLVGIYASAGVLAGAAGMPLYGTIKMLFDTLFDAEDEEGDDFDSYARMYLGELGYRGPVNYITGVNVASRVGLGDFLFRDQFTRSDMPLAYQYLETVGGPFVGVYLNAERGFKLFGEGELYRGFEAMAPAAIKNGLKSIRYYKDEGAETISGDKIIGDLHPAHLAAQFFGFTPAEYSRQLEINADAKGSQIAAVKRRSRLLNMYFRAYFEGDNSRMKSVVADMEEYNKDHPENPITRSTLSKSKVSRINSKKEKYHGLTFPKKTRDRYIQYLEEFGDDYSMFF